MAVTEINLVGTSYSDRVENGHLKISFTQHYEAIIDDPSGDSAIEVGTDPRLPQRGSAYATSTGYVVWCQSVGDVSIQARDANRTVVQVPVLFTNDTENWPLDSQGQPTDNPAEVAQKVTITAEEIRVPIDKAEYLGTFNQKDEIWINIPDLAIGDQSPIINSAHQPQERFTTVYRDVIRIVDFKRTWDNTWDTYKGAINDDEVTIAQEDGEGTRLSKTYGAYNLLCQTVQQEDVWKDGKLWFKRTIVLRHNQDGWYHKVPDMGVVERQANGNFAGLFVEDNTVAVSEPVKLNGEGKAQPTTITTGEVYDAKDTFYTWWRSTPELDFQELIDGE